MFLNQKHEKFKQLNTKDTKWEDENQTKKEKPDHGNEPFGTLVERATVLKTRETKRKNQEDTKHKARGKHDCKGQKRPYRMVWCASIRSETSIQGQAETFSEVSCIFIQLQAGVPEVGGIVSVVLGRNCPPWIGDGSVFLVVLSQFEKAPKTVQR